MTATSTASPSASTLKDRKQQTTVNPFLVRCICITATFLITGCGVLGFGLTCVLLSVVDPSAAPCPNHLVVIVFSVAGGLLLLSLILLIHLCSRKKRLNREALLEDIPVKEDVAHYKKKLSNAGVEEVVMTPTSEEVGAEENRNNRESHPVAPLANSDDESNFVMTQKSADVSYWIEQQKPDEIKVGECFSLDPTDGSTIKEENEDENECSDGEMTAL